MQPSSTPTRRQATGPTTSPSSTSLDRAMSPTYTPPRKIHYEPGDRASTTSSNGEFEAIGNLLVSSGDSDAEDEIQTPVTPSKDKSVLASQKGYPSRLPSSPPKGKADGIPSTGLVKVKSVRKSRYSYAPIGRQNLLDRVNSLERRVEDRDVASVHGHIGVVEEEMEDERDEEILSYSVPSPTKNAPKHGQEGGVRRSIIIDFPQPSLTPSSPLKSGTSSPLSPSPGRPQQSPPKPILQKQLQNPFASPTHPSTNQSSGPIAFPAVTKPHPMRPHIHIPTIHCTPPGGTPPQIANQNRPTLQSSPERFTIPELPCSGTPVSPALAAPPQFSNSPLSPPRSPFSQDASSRGSVSSISSDSIKGFDLMKEKKALFRGGEDELSSPFSPRKQGLNDVRINGAGRQESGLRVGARKSMARGVSGVDFWKRFSMSVRLDQVTKDGKSESEWLNETQQRKRKIWLSILIGFLLIAVIAAGIAAAVVIKQNNSSNNL